MVYRDHASIPFRSEETLENCAIFSPRILQASHEILELFLIDSYSIISWIMPLLRKIFVLYGTSDSCWLVTDSCWMVTDSSFSFEKKCLPEEAGR
jgi:hypothetical protein